MTFDDAKKNFHEAVAYRAAVATHGHIRSQESLWIEALFEQVEANRKAIEELRNPGSVVHPVSGKATISDSARCADQLRDSVERWLKEDPAGMWSAIVSCYGDTDHFKEECRNRGIDPANAKGEM